MTNIKEIEKFLEDFATLYIQEPNRPISDRDIYGALAAYGLNATDLNDMDLSNENNILKNLFAGAENINVYYSDLQPGFLQFSSRHEGGSKCVKLYMSVAKKDFISANRKIFSFINAHKMVTFSKTAKRLRSDSIVIRLRNYEDAKKVLDFINNDEELVHQAKSTNPFSFKEGVVGVGYDDRLSYNSTVSVIITEYLTDLRANNALHHVSVEGFAKYVEDYYRNTFINCSNLNKLINKQHFKEYIQRVSSVGYCVNNYAQVTQLLLNTLKGNMNFDKYKQYYDNCCDERKNNEMIEYYNQVVNNIQNPYAQIQNVQPQVDRNRLLEDYIALATKKYGEDGVAKYLISYIQGNQRAITRDGDFRNSFSKYLPPHVLKQMMGPTPEYYVYNVINGEPKENEKYDLFVTTCMETMRKYSKAQLVVALKKAVQNDFRYFTNGNQNLREQLKQKVSVEDIIHYCRVHLELQNYKLSPNTDVFNVFCDSIGEYMSQQQNITY